jgi:hypothetical protein
MKTLLISYMIGLNLLVYIFLPDVVVRPLDIIPRLAFYLAFPLAIFISTIVILLRNLLQASYKKIGVEKQNRDLNLKPIYSLI